jgi:hypothetical protein
MVALISLPTHNFNQGEMVMSQRTHEQSNAKNAPRSEQKKQEPPTGGVSPDDPFPVKEPGTGKPGQLQK